MANRVNWVNPYAEREGKWYRGNLHTHSSPASTCASVPMAQMVRAYTAARYDFLCMSDHMTLSRPKGTGLVFLPGVEWDADGKTHTGLVSTDLKLLERGIGIRHQDKLLETFADAEEALTILNHPNWQPMGHYRHEQLAAAGPFDGIEVYNGVIERLEGAAIATEKWDFLLAGGRRVLGFASDDAHLQQDVAQGWICVRAPERTAAVILGAIRSGNFYCSTGVAFSDIRREGSVLRVDAPEAEELQAIGTGGVLLERRRGPRLELDVAKLKQAYVRFTAYGFGSAMAWTQPFFVKG